MSRDQIQLFEDQSIRTAWDAEQEEWYFSVVDVVRVLTDQQDARHASTYWAVLKKRLKAEGADQLLTNCKQLKMTASDGKKRNTDVIYIEKCDFHRSNNIEMCGFLRFGFVEKCRGVLCYIGRSSRRSKRKSSIMRSIVQ